MIYEVWPLEIILVNLNKFGMPISAEKKGERNRRNISLTLRQLEGSQLQRLFDTEKSCANKIWVALQK